MKSLSMNHILNYEKFDFTINETIKNINLNGYLPLITTGLYIELNKIIKNKLLKMKNFTLQLLFIM